MTQIPQNIQISQLEEKTELLLDDEFPFIRKQGNEYTNYKVKKSNISSIIPDATSTVSGIIKLTGDLGGTSVNPTVPGLSLKTSKLIPIVRQTASYTLTLAEADYLVEMNVATANNLTIPPNSTAAFPIGTQIMVAQYGAGQTTIVAGSEVTLRSEGGKLKLSSQYSGATLIKIATDEWYVFGNLTA